MLNQCLAIQQSKFKIFSRIRWTKEMIQRLITLYIKEV